MNTNEKAQWRNKNKKTNANVFLKYGMNVVDENGFSGVVVKIVPATSDFHGSIHVSRGGRVEHYCYDNWQEFLRILPGE